MLINIKKDKKEKPRFLDNCEFEFSAIYDMVKEFHTKFGHPVEEKNLNLENVLLRLNLIAEESLEGSASFTSKDGKFDSIAYLDALGDTAYVVAGLAVLFADARYVAINTVRTAHNFAMSQLDESKEVLLRTPFRHALSVTASLRNLYAILSMDGEFTFASQAAFNHALVSVGMFFGYATYITNLANLRLIEIVAAIHESNMSKLWSSDTTTRQEQVKRCKYNADDIGFRLVNGGWVGYRLSDDKVLKSPDYKPVDLTKFGEIFDKSSLAM